jgi:hypothetical protein
VTNYLNPTTRSGGTQHVVVAPRPPAVEVTEAPFDDTEYVRINGGWKQVSEAGLEPDTMAPSPPTGLDTIGTIVTGGGAVDYELSWVAPTTNVDTSPLVDLAYYVLRWRYGAGAWVTSVSNDTSAVIRGLKPAFDFEWQVLARDYSGNDSAWATDTVVGIADTVGPEKPSLPILETHLGTISSRWNGLDHAGNPQPDDFDHLEWYDSAAAAGPWNYIGRASGASTLIVTNVPVGATRYFSFIAVDTSGNASVRSSVANIVVQGVKTPDIDTTVFDGIDADIAASLTAAELDAQEKADLAEAAAINSSKDYVQSRGTNLITNGSGSLGDNTNFSTLAFSKADAPTGISGAFVTTLGSAAIPITDEFFPVDPLKKCRLSFYMKQLGTTVGGYAYAFVYPHDAFKLPIDPGHVMYIAGTQTTLAAPLNPGDTTVTLTSSANWYGTAGKPAGASIHLRRIIFWDYVDAGGKAWPQETYSRNVTATDYWADGGITGNVITLRAPYAGAAKPAGTKLSNGSSGGTFMYGGAVNTLIPKAWTRYAESITGIMAGGVGASFANGWPQGTAFAKAGFLVNRTLAGPPDAASQHAVAGISFGDAEAAAYDANNITEVQITTDAITAPKIKAGAVIAGKLAADSVLANNIKAGEVVAGKLAADSVATLNLQAGAITATKIGASAVEAGKIAANAVQATNIEAGAVTSNAIFAGAVQAQHLTTVLALVSKICSSETGRRWEADSAGIRVYEADGSILINFPTDPDTPSSFYGDLVATSLTVSDQLAIRGLVNEISKGAQVVLASGTTAPSGPPSIAIDWEAIDTRFVDGDPSYDGFNAARYGWTRWLGYWWTAQTTYGQPAALHSYDDAGNRQVPSPQPVTQNIQHGSGGVTVLGTNIYVLGKRQMADFSWQWWVEGFNTSGTRIAQWQYTLVANSREPRLGNDGTNLVIAYSTTTENKLRWVTRNPTTGAAVSSFGGFTNLAKEMNVMYHGNADFGGPRIMFVAANDPNVYVSTGSAYSPNENFPLPSSNIMGLDYDGTVFWSHDAGGYKMYKHTTTKWTTESSLWWTSNTWFDSNATGGTHETAQSPRKSFTMKKRARLQVTTGLIPVRPVPNTNDDAVAARVYIGRGAADPGRTFMERMSTLADGVRNLVLTAVTLPAGAATNPPPAASDFPTSSPGRIISADGTSLVMNGDGSGNWGSSHNAPVVSSTGVVTGIPRCFDASGTVPIVANGAASSNIVVNFPAGRFTVAPKVTVSSGSGRLNPYIVSITTSAVTFAFNNWSGANSSATTYYLIAQQAT